MSDPTDTETAAGERACECPPCPGRGNDGHGMTHCAECCFGTGVEADIACPIHGETSLPAPVREPDEAAVDDALAQALYAKDKVPGEGGWLPWEEHSEKVRDIWRRYAVRFLASDWLAQYTSKARAAELREAADAGLAMGHSMVQSTPGIQDWLRERADRIDGGAR